ncbi:MAG: FeoB-associated Cys-rich membrane protein [Clostridia bacterium]
MLATIIISIILIALLTMIIYKQIKNKKEGKSSCGCGCSGCAMSDICHSGSKNQK